MANSWCEMLQIMSCFFPFAYCSHPIILVQVNLGFISAESFIWASSFWIFFLVKSMLVFLVLTVTSGKPSVWTFRKAFLNFGLCEMICVPPREHPWHGYMLWSCFTESRKEFCTHPLMLSSVVFRPFPIPDLLISQLSSYFWAWFSSL